MLGNGKLEADLTSPPRLLQHRLVRLGSGPPHLEQWLPSHHHGHRYEVPLDLRTMQVRGL